MAIKIKQLFKDGTIRKILFFFNENPHSIDTAKGISIWVGCDIDAVRRALRRLVEEGIVVNHRTTFTDAYSYTTRRDISKKIETYIKRVDLRP